MGLALLAAVCFACWTITLKSIKKWRFELYFYDYAFGFVILGVATGLLLGSVNSQELSMQDNLFLTGYRKMAYCVAAGFIFGAGNLLLAGAVSLSGMGVAFTISLGVALLIGAIRTAVTSPGNVMLDATGAGLVLLAIVVAAVSNRARHQDIRDSETNVALQPDPRWKQGERLPPPAGSLRGTLVAIASGLLLGASQPVLDASRLGEDGIAPYGLGLFLAVGLLISAFLFSPFLCVFPLRGRTLRIRDYFKGGVSNHMLGLVGGMISAVGILAGLLVWGAPATAKAGASTIFGAQNATAVLAGAMGLLLWKEFEPATSRTRLLFLAALALFAAGVAVTAFGQS